MLLFLNIDCVLSPPADALGPLFESDAGVRRLESVLSDWPQLRLVVTSDRRYRMTLGHFRGFFAVEFRHSLIATTPLYGERRRAACRTREDEVLDWLDGSTLGRRPWLAVDSCVTDYVTCADKLLLCTTLTLSVVIELNAALLRLASVNEFTRVPPGRLGAMDDRPCRPGSVRGGLLPVHALIAGRTSMRLDPSLNSSSLTGNA